MLETLTGGTIYLQTVYEPAPVLCGLLHQDDRGLAVVDAAGSRYWVPWPWVLHLEQLGAPTPVARVGEGA